MEVAKAPCTRISCLLPYQLYYAWHIQQQPSEVSKLAFLENSSELIELHINQESIKKLRSRKHELKKKACAQKSLWLIKSALLKVCA